MPRSIKNKYPRIFIDWHPALNGNLNPTLVKKSSTKKFYWKCHKERCGFVWRDTINGRISLQRGCPQCESRLKNRKVADKFEINETIKAMQAIIAEIEPYIPVFLNDEEKKFMRTRASKEIRKHLTKFEKLNLELRKSVLNQKKFELKKKKYNE
jgi:predicted  nucleic acid-binding Zn-ribbon protein